MAGAFDDRLRVLHVEDDDADAVRFRRRMPADRFDVIRARTATEAGDLARRLRPDVVVLDLDLPDAAGPPLVQRIHEAVPDRPIVVLSGEEDERLAWQAVRRHADDVVWKSEIDRRDMAAAVTVALERSRQRARDRQAREAPGRCLERALELGPAGVVAAGPSAADVRDTCARHDLARLGLPCATLCRVGEHRVAIVHDARAPDLAAVADVLLADLAPDAVAVAALARPGIDTDGLVEDLVRQARPGGRPRVRFAARRRRPRRLEVRARPLVRLHTGMLHAVGLKACGRWGHHVLPEDGAIVHRDRARARYLDAYVARALAVRADHLVDADRFHAHLPASLLLAHRAPVAAFRDHPGEWIVALRFRDLPRDPAAYRDTLALLRLEGVRVALYGVEDTAAAMQAVLRIRPDEIVMHRTWLQGLRTGGLDAGRALVEDLRGVSVWVGVEGVDTDEDLDLAIEAGVDLASGDVWR